MTQPKWRALTEPPIVCDDRVRKVYDATTGKKFPVEWVEVPQVDREAATGLDNCG